MAKDGSLQRSLDGNACREVYDIEPLPGDKLLTAGAICRDDKYVQRLNADGTEDESFGLQGSGFDSYAIAAAMQADGKAVIGGVFTSYDGVPAAHLIRLNPDGSRDSTFRQQGSGLVGQVRDVKIQPDGKILVGGQLTSFDGQPVSGVVRLNSDGTRDTGFTPPMMRGKVMDMLLQGDGRIVVGGYFGLGVGQSKGLIRLHTDGTQDRSFDTRQWCNICNVTSFVAQSDGRLIVGLSNGDLVRVGSTQAMGKPAMPQLSKVTAQPRALKIRWKPSFGADRYVLRAGFTAKDGKRKVKRVRLPAPADYLQTQKSVVRVKLARKSYVSVRLVAVNRHGASRPFRSGDIVGRDFP
jgi:uncharacterized delta-60 repeat protein